MNVSISIFCRVGVFIALWIAAGMIWASFAPLCGFSVEAGESQVSAQFAMIYLGPLLASEALAFSIIPGGYNAWPHRQVWEQTTACVILGLIVVHGIVAISRKRRKDFIMWTIVQVAFLVGCIAAVLYYFHWDSLHMHG